MPSITLRYIHERAKPAAFILIGDTLTVDKNITIEDVQNTFDSDTPVAATNNYFPAQLTSEFTATINSTTIAPTYCALAVFNNNSDTVIELIAIEPLPPGQTFPATFKFKFRGLQLQ